MTTVMLKCKVDITHRTASEVCNILNRPNTYGTALYLKKWGEDRACNAKSLLGLLSMVLREGDIVEFNYEATSGINLVELLSDYFKEV